MKFFRAAAPGLVALAVLLGTVPVFASEAPDPPDAYVPEAGEVLTDGPDTSAPAGDEPVTDNPSASAGDIPAVDDTPSDTDGGGSGPVLSEPVSVTCSGSDVTVYLDDRSYTSVADVGGGEPPVMEDTPGEVPVDSVTLPGFLRTMFGEYTPKTQTVSTYFDGQLLEVSTEYVPGIAGMDMEWIASVALFGLVVYCLFRMLGGMVR